MIDAAQLLDELGIAFTRRGQELWSSCPMPEHDDSTPSWSLLDSPGNPQHLYWHCYGCGASGAAVTLVRRVFGWTERGGGDQARAWLAEREDGATTALPRSVGVELRGYAGRHVFELPPGVVVDQPLDQWPTAPRDYAAGRGLGAQQVERWGIGYALGGRLAGRLVMPLADERGVVGSYQARTFVGSLTKYQTPDEETEQPVPGSLFGRRWWGAAPGRRRLVLCEGALDALACERCGAEHVAALSGAGCLRRVGGEDQIDPAVAALLATWPVVLVVTDPDRAGDKLAGIVSGAVGRYSDCRRVRLPAGLDACAMTSTLDGRESLRQALLRGGEPARDLGW